MDRDRNLLFGVLAVQLKKVTASQLVAAAGAWAADRSRSLGEWLVQQAAINEVDRKFIDDVVARAVHDHADDAAATLRSFGGDAVVEQTFAGSIVLTSSGGIETGGTADATKYLGGEPIAGVQETPGRYTHVSEYGRGGMGRVLLVHDAFLGRDVALKELLPGPTPKNPESPSTPVRKYMGFLSRFMQEARITGQLEHPAIVPVYELGHRNDGTLYYTMKLVRGRTLRQAIHECKSLEQRLTLLPHFVDLCLAVAYAHSRRIIHRDIKPDNVMVGEFGETVVLDWGLAKSKDAEDFHADGIAETIRLLNLGDVDSADKTQYGQILGTPAYMSPEQARGDLHEVNERSDVYSLGAVLYELLTGQPPFSGNSVPEILGKVSKQRPTPVRQQEAKVPAELDAICERAMQKESDRRYQSAREFADDIQRFQSGALVRAYRYTRSQRVRRFVRRNKALVALTLAALLVFVVVNSAYIFRLTGAAKTEQRLREASEWQTYVSNIALANEFVESKNFAGAIDYLWKTPAKERNWEWGYLLNVCSQELAELNDELPEPDVTISPNGALVMLSNWQGQKAELLDAATGRPHATIQHTDYFRSPIFSPDGSSVLGVCKNEILFWDVATGALRNRLTLQDSSHEIPLECFHISISPDGRFIGTSYLNSREVALWDAASGALVWRIDQDVPGDPKPYRSTVLIHRRLPFAYPYDNSGATIPDLSLLGVYSTRSAAWAGLFGVSLNEHERKRETFETSNLRLMAFFAHSRRLLLTDGERRRVCLFDIDDRKEIWSRDSVDAISDIALSSDEKFAVLQMASPTTPPPLRILDIESGAMLEKVRGHGIATRTVFSPDGRLAVLGGSDRAINVFDLEDQSQTQMQTGHSDTVNCACFSPDGSWIITGSADKTLRVWDATTRTLVRSFAGHYHPIRGIAIAANADRLITSSYGYQVLLWDTRASVPSGHTIRLVDASSYSRFSRTGNRVLSADSDGLVSVRESASGNVLCRLPDADLNASLASFSDDDASVAIPTREDAVTVWDTNTGKRLSAITGMDSPLQSILLSPNGRFLITRHDKAPPQLWRLGASPVRMELKQFSNIVNENCSLSDATFDPSETYVATAYSSAGKQTALKRSLRDFQPVGGLWSLESGKEIARFRHYSNGFNSAPQFSIDGNTLFLMCGRYLHAWETATAHLQTTFAVNESGSLVDCAIDSTYLLSLNGSRVTVVDVRAPSVVQNIVSSRGQFIDASFNRNASRFLTVTDAGDIGVFDTRTGTYLLGFHGVQASFLDDANLFLAVEGPGSFVRREALPWKLGGLDSISNAARMLQLSQWKILHPGEMP